MDNRARMRSGREFDLIAKLAEGAADRGASGVGRLVVGIGDDAAVTEPRGATATSVDMVVEGVHFRRGTSSVREVGRKALSVALSDLAAMGAEPGEAYAALAIPPDLDEEGCLQLFGGLAEVAAETNTALAGGDLSMGPALTLALTVVGHAASADLLVGRGGARPGHSLAVTGELGGAAAGLLLLERPELRSGMEPEIADALLRRHRDPVPRLAAGRALAAAGAAAMVDVSDGLGADAEQIAAASDAALRIELDRLPIQAGVSAVARAAGRDPLELAAEAGEDYELLVAIPPERFSEAAAATRRVGIPLAPIGEVTRGTGAELRGPDGELRPARGFDHFDRR
jgi:thiamine-monophosphate kinase